MNKMQKQLDQKVRIIDKIQNHMKSNRIKHSNLIKNSSLEFPPINNVVMTFPIKSSPRNTAVHSIHTPSKKIQQELQQIFTKNNVQLNGHNVSRIIFGGPMKSRMALDSTFRASFGMNNMSMKRNYHSLSKNKLSTKKLNQSASRTINPEFQSIEKQTSIENLKQLHTLTPSIEVKKTTQQSNMYNPFTTQNSYKMKQTLRSTKRNQLHLEGIPKSLGRYSPWGNHDDQQII